MDKKDKWMHHNARPKEQINENGDKQLKITTSQKKSSLTSFTRWMRTLGQNTYVHPNSDHSKGHKRLYLWVTVQNSLLLSFAASKNDPMYCFCSFFFRWYILLLRYGGAGAIDNRSCHSLCIFFSPTFGMRNTEAEAIVHFYSSTVSSMTWHNTSYITPTSAILSALGHAITYKE